MSRVFENYPLPWATKNISKPVTRQNNYGYGTSNTTLDMVTCVVDANGKEVPINTVDFLTQIVEITGSLTKPQAKRLGQNSRSTQLFTVKNNYDNTYAGGTKLLPYAKMWRTKRRAEIHANRMNLNYAGRYQVVEVKMSATA